MKLPTRTNGIATSDDSTPNVEQHSIKRPALFDENKMLRVRGLEVDSNTELVAQPANSASGDTWTIKDPHVTQIRLIHKIAHAAIRDVTFHQANRAGSLYRGVKSSQRQVSTMTPIENQLKRSQRVLHIRPNDFLFRFGQIPAFEELRFHRSNLVRPLFTLIQLALEERPRCVSPAWVTLKRR